MQKTPNTTNDFRPAPLPRRLAAMVYDALLVAALWMLIGGVGVAINGGEAVEGPLLNSCLFLTTFIFFAAFWTRSGQTLGMMAWRIRIQTSDGHSISLMQALIRFFTAFVSFFALGLGYWWVLFDTEQRSWHDRYSESRVVLLPPRKK